MTTDKDARGIEETSPVLSPGESTPFRLNAANVGGGIAPTNASFEVFQNGVDASAVLSGAPTYSDTYITTPVFTMPDDAAGKIYRVVVRYSQGAAVRKNFFYIECREPE